MMSNDMKYNEQGLLPCIAQDATTGEVLMLAYMNEEAIDLTVKTGYATYFSRSRNEIWVKGKTSGHLQKVVSMRYDCDKDTILLLVDQTGAACHTGEKTCFYREFISNGEKAAEDIKKCSFENSNAILKDYKTIMERKENPKEGSYTNYLLDKGVEKICKKVGEESSEIIIAAMKGDKKELIYEISDFMYHVSVLMADKDITWNDVFEEIENRRK